MYSNYHKAICEEMSLFANDEKVLFLGQQVASEDFYNTLKDISMSKRREMPVAEEMQMGISIGLALQGYLPISIYQRMDFLPRACDQLVNHLNLFKELSRDKFNPKVIIRTTIGSTKPFNVGIQHNKNLVDGFRALLTNIPILEPMTEAEVHKDYDIARNCQGSIIIVERQDLYNE